jgi:GT2 family glycosyltransferase
MRLIVEGAKRGVAAARNVGAMAAAGDVIVFLNADVQPAPDFLTRISGHYAQGADYVAVDAQVINVESTYARYIEAQHQHLYGSNRPVGWTEGFSCRRTLAIEAGLFPDVLPGAGGEDVEFVTRLVKLGAKGVVDKSIVVRHVTPSAFGDFWRQWEGRGAAVPFLRLRVHHIGWPRMVAERVAAALWSILLGVTIVPAVVSGVRLARRSERGWRDVPRFIALSVVQPLAHRVGEWKGVMRAWRDRRPHAG